MCSLRIFSGAHNPATSRIRLRNVWKFYSVEHWTQQSGCPFRRGNVRRKSLQLHRLSTCFGVAIGTAWKSRPRDRASCYGAGHADEVFSRGFYRPRYVAINQLFPHASFTPAARSP